MPPPESPAYYPVKSPDMPPPESPAYYPVKSPDMPPPESPEESPQYIIGTPDFEPMSPATAPITKPKGYFIDTPSDSENSPPTPPSLPNTPEKTYKGGERVSYNKDTIPGRPWRVTPLNKPNLFKIESEGPNQEVEIVTPLDIKPYETHIPLTGYSVPQNGQSTIPSINIAPVFNMPGSTSMPEMSNANQHTSNETIKIPANDFVSNDKSFSAAEPLESAPEEDTSSKMDFNKIIIKKV